MAGRKSLKEEINVVKYMTELAGPTFKFIQDCLESEDKADKKWASDQMMRLYMKAIPQELTTDPNQPLVITWQSSKSPINQEPGLSDSTTPQSDGTSLSSTEEPEKQQQS